MIRAGEDPATKYSFQASLLFLKDGG